MPTRACQRAAGRPDNASFIRCGDPSPHASHGPHGRARPGAPNGRLPVAPVPDPGLCGALLNSRQRWRDFATLAADLVFETDAEGRFTFVAPEAPLGWAADALLGRPGRDLLAVPEPDPFALHGPARGLRAWLRRPDGGSACLSLSLAPLHDTAGRFVGLRGCGRDISAEMAEAETQAAALRRAEALQSLVSRVRREVLAPRMLTATLESLQGALGCVGAAVLEWPDGSGPVALHRHGGDPAPLLAGLAQCLGVGGPSFFDGPGGERLALVPQQPHADTAAGAARLARRRAARLRRG